MSLSVHLQVFVLLAITLNACRGEEECTKGAVHTCSDCIVSGASCSWCKSVNFTNQGETDAARCDTKAKLMARGCLETDIIDPKNKIHLIKQKPLSGTDGGKGEPVQIKPQEVKLDLRPGLRQIITLQFRRAEGYPVDLYYLMDLSYSMKDDLEKLKSLGQDLVTVLQEITGSKDKAKIGFGSFVDKTVLPFTNTNKEKLKYPCPEGSGSCQPPFGYKHIVDLTNNYKQFNDEVAKQFISGNLDSPEGGLDAIMQAAMCESHIGWGNATRLLVLATDAGFHMAGDGKLAAILEPNDEACHLTPTENIYNKSNLMDYPSVGQIARTLEKKNIQPIFAVTDTVKQVYDELSKMIPKSEVGELSKDSSNVVKLIKDAYNKLSSKVIVTHDALPEKVTVRYTSSCDSTPRDEGICDNVQLNQEVVFYVEVTAEDCLDNVTFYVGPRGFTEKMKVTVSTRCECECDDPVNPNNPVCAGQGEVKCGTCKCNPGFSGLRCECDQKNMNDVQLRQQCKADNTTECGGRGDCVCGQCQCHKSATGKPYYNKFCECVDEGCPMHDNKECSGNGDCKCGRCKCKEGYEGDACHCKTSNDACKTEGNSVCNGRGKCKCNTCMCERGYLKPFCLTCPTCHPPCQKSASCIECLGFEKGPYKHNCSMACGHLSHSVVERLTLATEARKCDVKDSENCWLYFTMKEKLGFDSYHVEILKERTCPEPPNIIAIVAGSVAGVALIGLLILLIIKALLYARDLKEWKKFENEKKKSKWSNADNPLFKEATTTVTNPTFSGE